MIKSDGPQDAHLRVFKMEVDEVSKIFERGAPLTADELEERGPDEVYLGDDIPEEPGLRHAIIVPASVGERIFPPVIVASPLFCFCSGYRWCLEVDRFGRIRYVLKCIYWCIPQFVVAA